MPLRTYRLWIEARAFLIGDLPDRDLAGRNDHPREIDGPYDPKASRQLVPLPGGPAELNSNDCENGNCTEGENDVNRTWPQGCSAGPTKHMDRQSYCQRQQPDCSEHEDRRARNSGPIPKPDCGGDAKGGVNEEPPPWERQGRQQHRAQDGDAYRQEYREWIYTANHMMQRCLQCGLTCCRPHPPCPPIATTGDRRAQVAGSHGHCWIVLHDTIEQPECLCSRAGKVPEPQFAVPYTTVRKYNFAQLVLRAAESEGDDLELLRPLLAF